MAARLHAAGILLGCICLVSTSCLSVNGVVPESQARNKNVLFFLVDDGGFESPVWGNQHIQTPHISALAKKGTVFHRAYTAVSSCSPSRAAILSGLPTHQNGMYGLHQPPGNFQSNADITSLPNLLNAAGYKTGVIGKYHVGPLPNYNFSYGMTKEHCWAGTLGSPIIYGNDPSCHANYNSVSRNVTNMKLFAREFLELEPSKPFFLYVGFGDVHRCEFESAIGSFCEFYGSGRHGQGTIPDWQNPKFYSPDEVFVPPFLPDNKAVREDIAAQYTAWDRLDKGVGLIMNELSTANVLDDTLVFFFSDNGIPFPSGKTNLLEQGQHEPLIISSPEARKGVFGGERSSNLVVSALDLVPTILDWAQVHYPSNAQAHGSPARLTGSSLMPLLDEDPPDWRDTAFGSHQFHSLYAYYPMRSMVTSQYRLIHNLNYNLRFPILEDVFHTKTWSDIEAAGESGNQTGWVFDYDKYMHRPEWQLFDVQNDPMCLHNLAGNVSLAKTLHSMQMSLRQWQIETSDPWARCNPSVPMPSTSWMDTHSEICAF